MTFDRRTALRTGLALSAGAYGSSAWAARKPPNQIAVEADQKPAATSSDFGLLPNAPHDQSTAFQAAIDAASERDVPISLAPGRYLVSGIQLRPATRLVGVERSSVLQYAGGATFLTAFKADGIVLSGITIDGVYKALDGDMTAGLISLGSCRDIALHNIEISHSTLSGIALEHCSGRIDGCTIANVLDAGLRSLDSFGLDVTNNTVADCANNGIQIWRREAGEDGSIVSGNRVRSIRAAAGGTGQNGNGINVFRAGGVLVANNRITDCAFSAVRGNAASNIQIIANSCERLGEVALYAEFAFEGAVIASNMIDGAAAGISVTNFNQGGRLAVIQGNLIRNLFRREDEPQDKRGEGIAVEADASVTGNTIDNAPTAGIAIGWGPWMRNVAATGNVIRGARIGIAVTDDPAAGVCLVANNLISDARDGAIRATRFAEPFGPDLATSPPSGGRLTVTGNLVS